MSTIITYPDALSLSRNLKKFLISSGVPVTFTLKKENQEILSEVYSPTPAGTIEIDIEDAVNDQLSLVLPISDVFTQPGTAADFSAIVDGVTKSFRVVKGGVCGLSITAVEFLKSNFLSWRPQTKSVTGTQPEWICYYAPEAAKIRCRFYNNNGTQAVTDLATLAAGECKSINVQFNRIINLNATKKLAYFDVWVENNSGVRLSYVQRYILIPGTNTERFFLFENSLGGIDCLSCTGEEVISPDSEFTLAEMDDETIQSAKRFEKWILQSTGFKNNIEALWIQDFFRSGQRYVVDSGTVKKIVLQESTIEINSRDAVNEFTFKYRSATDKGLLSLSRSLETPAGIEFPTAEQLFFLAPRLNEFLEADINESLLIPVQSPYQTVWKRLSVGALLSFLKAYADKFRHQHGNFPLLEKFSISLAGNLLFNGKEIAGGNGAVDLSNYYTKTTSDGRFAKLAGDLTQNFLANKFLSKTLVIPSAIPEGLAPGESAIYRRDTGFGGAIPEAGGLDRDAMWSELSINDSTKKVHLSHLPTIPYSQLSGTPFIPTWALAATKPSYGISEITGLQEALDNVSVDLSNYYTKTISDSRFAKLAGDLTQNFSAKKFLSKIFIIPSAVPEGLASGESAFYRRATGFGGANPGVGGLDRDAMWSELATNNTTKKIHNSHLNVPAWALAVSKPGYSYLEVGAAAASHEHSQYALSSSLSDYLPKTGGELTGKLTIITNAEGLYLKRTDAGYPQIKFENSTGVLGSIGVVRKGFPFYYNPDTNTWCQLWHEGNSNLSDVNWRCNALFVTSTIRAETPIGFHTASGAAQGINIKQLLVSNTYADASLIPQYGIYSKGSIKTNESFYAKALHLDNPGVRSWMLTPSYNDLVLKSGDGVGNCIFMNTIRSRMMMVLDQTNYGVFSTIGALNSSYFHFNIQTSGVFFHFNKNIYVQGDVFGGPSYNRRLAYADESLIYNIFNDNTPAGTKPGTGSYGYINSYGSYITFGHRDYYIMFYGHHTDPNHLSFRKYVNGTLTEYNQIYHTGDVKGIHGISEKSGFCEFTVRVNGDANTYYPVTINVVDSRNYIQNIITISKWLGQASGNWTGNHSAQPMSGAAGIYRYEYRTKIWDGNGGYLKTLHASYQYAPFVAHVSQPGSAVAPFVIWLRGGGADYMLSSNNPVTYTVYYSNTNIGSNSPYDYVVAPRTTVENAGVYNSINIPEVSSDKLCIPQGAPRYAESNKSYIYRRHM